jgi:hypothetical protein
MLGHGFWSHVASGIQPRSPEPIVEEHPVWYSGEVAVRGREAVAQNEEDVVNQFLVFGKIPVSEQVSVDR